MHTLSYIDFDCRWSQELNIDTDCRYDFRYKTSPTVAINEELKRCLRYFHKYSDTRPSPLVPGLAEVQIECEPDVVVNVASGVLGTATLEGPIAVASHGDRSGPFTFEPDVDTAISVSGGPGTSEVFTYTVTDVGGVTAQCSVRLSIGQGENVNRSVNFCSVSVQEMV